MSTHFGLGWDMEREREGVPQGVAFIGATSGSFYIQGCTQGLGRRQSVPNSLSTLPLEAPDSTLTFHKFCFHGILLRTFEFAQWHLSTYWQMGRENMENAVYLRSLRGFSCPGDFTSSVNHKSFGIGSPRKGHKNDRADLGTFLHQEDSSKFAEDPPPVYTFIYNEECYIENNFRWKEIILML